ncbi:MAG: hypothetical protein EHM48_00045 [Planctomycetaceae bacterium]|nr:MAG: hypothetical protein EHM48_00045 [Planctomycetaceae bacterium]
MVDDDMRTVELVTQAGEDTNPANGCRVVVINVPGYKVAVAVTDDLTPEVDPGEKEIYSTDNPATAKQARTLWDTAGNIVHNQGAKSSVTYAELDLALQAMINLIMAHVHTSAAPGNPTTAPTAPITLDISAAESPTVKLP